MGTKNILLVDDSTYDVELTLRALKSHQIINKIDVVRDGHEALDYLNCRGLFADREQGNPILTLLDLKMPKLDGIEVLRQIRASPVLELIPVVVFTSSREERDIVDSYELGANAYIVKPVGFAKFSETVQQLGLFWSQLNEPPPNQIQLRS
jgi:CheY-like chemotaxis protein